ncbi:ATP-binding cassette, subfamily B [Carnobacterium iners]|nr:ATP-binding cassette, subfamily B [Carnobacterium iners]
MKQKSNWSQSIPLKQQIKIIKRIFSFGSPFKKNFFIGIFFGVLLSVTNVVLPRIIQIFIDDYLTTETATIRIIALFALA